MAELTPDIKLLDYLDQFGVGVYKPIRDYLEEIFPYDKAQAKEDYIQEIELFLSDMQQHGFIKSKNRYETKTAAIQPVGVTYLRNRKDETKDLGSHRKTTHIVVSKNSKLEKLSWIAAILAVVLTVFQIIKNDSIQNNVNSHFPKDSDTLKIDTIKQTNPLFGISDSSIRKKDTVLIHDTINNLSTSAKKENPKVYQDFVVPPPKVSKASGQDFVNPPARKNYVNINDLRLIENNTPDYFSINIYYDNDNTEMKNFATELYNKLGYANINLFLNPYNSSKRKQFMVPPGSYFKNEKFELLIKEDDHVAEIYIVSP